MNFESLTDRELETLMQSIYEVKKARYDSRCREITSEIITFLREKAKLPYTIYFRGYEETYTLEDLLNEFVLEVV